MRLRTTVTVFIVVFVLASVVGMVLFNEQLKFCTLDAMVCPDGTSVGRDAYNNCEFNSCPELQSCDALNTCPIGTGCYDFPGDNEEAYCYLGPDPCIKCPSFECDIMESYPMQIACI